MKDIVDDWDNVGNTPLDDEDIAIDKRDFINEESISNKSSGEKTVEERIKTSRSLKIKNNKWNQVDYTEDFSNEKITIDPHYCQYNSTYEDVDFQEKFQAIIENSKYRELLLGEDKNTVNYQTVNDIIIFCYGKLKRDYTLTQIFVMVCEYCNIGLQAMWKRSSSYIQLQVLEELKEISKLPNEILNNNIKLF